MAMHGLIQHNTYRYAFNGMERDDEVKGAGNSYDFGARMMDSRLGRWLSIDKKHSKYPGITPYSYCNSSPILYVDPNGEDIYIHYYDENGKEKVYNYTPGIQPLDSKGNKIKSEGDFLQKVHEAITFNMEVPKGKQIWNSLAMTHPTKPVAFHIKRTQIFEGPGVREDHKVSYVGPDPNSSLALTAIPVEKGVEVLGKNPTNGGKAIDGGTIFWDPALEVRIVDDEGKLVVGPKVNGEHIDYVLIPSTVLLHEGGHAMSVAHILNGFKGFETPEKKLQGLKDYAAGANTYTGDPYVKKEERDNIINNEQVYIQQWIDKENDENTTSHRFKKRTNHGGQQIPNTGGVNNR